MQNITRSRSHRQARGGCRVAADVDRSRGSLARRVEHLRRKKAKKKAGKTQHESDDQGKTRIYNRVQILRL